METPIEELLEEYPSLEREDILACLDYAAALADEQQVKKKNASLKDNLLLIAD